MYRACRGPWLIVSATIALGCMGERESRGISTPPEEAIGRVDASPDNTILTVGGTVQLQMAAQSLTGVPLTTFDSVNYRLSVAGDSATVRVTTDGLVKAIAPTGSSVPVNVIAMRSGTWNGDQVLVQVMPSVVQGLTLSIQPPPGDSAKLSSGTVKTITPILRNPTTGASLSGIQLQYAVKAADELRVGVFTGSVSIRSAPFVANFTHEALSPSAARNQIVPYVSEGTAWVYANVNAYGTLLRDSVQYTLTYPYTGSIRVSKVNLAVATSLNTGVATAATENPSIILAPGGTVTFANGVAAPDPLVVTFTFDAPGAATAASPASSIGGASGNITPLLAGQSSNRRFITPGTYRWTWVAGGGQAPWNGQTASGTIVVK